MKKTTLRQAALKLALVAVALLAPLGLRAQSLAEYTFSTGTDASKWVTLTSPTTLFTEGGDSKASDVTGIGFSFPFGEETYTQFSVNTDGNLRLGSTKTGTTNYEVPFNSSKASYNNPKINAFGCDGYGASSHYVKYQLFETNLLVVEFCMGTYTSSTRNNLYLWQIQLHANGDIEIVFPDASGIPATAPAVDHQCGLCIDNSDGWVITLSNNQATHFTNGSTTTNSSGTWFDANRYYKFARPVIACPKPTGVTASNILHDEATIGWTSTESAWQIVYSTDENFDPDAASPTSAVTTSHTISGLTPLTDYYAYVRSNCTASGNGYSDWSNKLHFTTTAQATVVGDSWSDDFEGASCGWELVNGTQTNQWVWGTAVNNGGTHALYVSNDGGTSNAYSHSSTMVYATKLLNFANNKYEFTYDWKANGESTYDYLRVALVPASVTLTAGTTPSDFSATGLPTDWIALDGGSKLNLVTSWQNKSVAVNITAGNYYLVVAWKNDGGGGTQPPAAVDNVSITRVACPYDVAGLAVANDPAVTQTTATVTWTAGEATQWQVATKTGDADWTILPSIYNTNSVALTGLTAATTYQVKVRAYCNDTDQGTWCAPISLTTACPEYVTIPDGGWTENFDGYTLTSSYTPSSRTLPTCWNYINTSTYSENKWYPTMHYYSYTDYSNSSPNYIRFYIVTNSSYDRVPRDQYLILPAMQDVDGLRIKLQARAYSTGTGYDATFKVGVMTDPTDASTFVAIATKTPTTTSYEQYTIPFNTYSGGGTYIAIKVEVPETPSATYTSAYRAVCIDDILVEEIPSCLEPTAASVVENSETVNSVQLTWTSGNETPETNWKLQYKKATDENYTTVNVTSAQLTDGKYTLTGLDASTVYNWQVAAWCDPNNAEALSPYTAGPNFTTACEAITVDAEHHYTENFNSYTAGTSSTSTPATYPDDELPLCWQFLNRSDNSNTYPQAFLSSSEDYAVSGNCLFFKSSSTTPLYAILPEFTNNISDLMLTFTYRNEGTNASNGTLYVSYMTDPTDASTFNTANAIACDRTTTKTEKEVFFENAPAGSYIAFKYQGGSSNNYYLSIDDVTVEPAPTCRKPSALAYSATTAHTATLSWTKGSNDQDAWQIAYSTSNSFAPAANFTPGDGEGLVAADNNTSFEVTGLAQSTTYYAYVRANCGNDDYSAWCNTKVTFTTLAGNVTPTGLAVAPATITSRRATASWNAVAGNTLHQSYDIYWAESSVTEVPAEPAAPNLIAGINATSQEISSLDAETTYKVWVRDNCGTDGLSNWSSPVTFTTAASCQIPDGLVASNVTNNSATISWNTYGQSDFNLRYSTDGENWTTEPDINTPYTLDGVLTGNTAYQVQVQAACNTEEWSTTLSFTTKCDAITDYPVTYGFETSEGFPANANTPTTNQLGNCWRNEATVQNGNYSTRVWGTSTAYKHGGSQALILPDKGNSTNFAKTMLVFPAMSFTSANGYKVSFWINRSATGSNPEGFKVYASPTDTIDVSAVFLGHYSRNYNIAYPQIETAGGWYQYDIYVPRATITDTVYLIFEGQSYYGNATYVDDITIDEAPSCYPLGTLTYANVGTHSVELSWPLVDNGQTAWVVEYADNSEFNNFQTASANTHTDFELAGLTPETHYWVRVKANCGNDDYSEVSNVVDFTTGIACPAPTALAYDNTSLTETSVDLSWTENGGATEWIVAYKAEGDADSTEVTATTDTNYTLTGTLQHPLTQGTNYTVKVRANCGNVNGLSQWSNVVNFQTVAACPAPTNLAVTDNSETAHGARITWDGNVDNDSYTVEYAEGPLAGLATLLNEGFEGGSMPAGWSHTGSTWTVGSGSGNSSGESSAANGTYNATFYNGSATPEYLITPAINMEGMLSATLTFNYVNPAWAGGIYSLTVYYRVGEGAWQELVTYNTAQASWTQKTINLTGLADNYQIGFYAAKYNNDYGYGTGIDDVKITAEYTPSYSWNTLEEGVTSPYTINTLDPETQYVVRVKGVCGSTPSPASNIVGFTTLEACGAPTAFVLGAVEAHQATFSWTTGIANTAWKVYVKEHGAAEYPVAYTNANTTSVTIDGLEDNTAYDVKIVPTCNESKILEVENAFTTECDAITVFPWSETFDELTEASSIPDCWDNSEGTTTNDSYKWCYNTSTSGNGATNGTSHDGSNCIRFNSYNNSEGYTNFLKTPVLNFPDGIPMSLYFWYKKPVAGAGFSVYISTDGGATYTTPLAENLAQKTSWYEQTIPLTNYVGADNIVIVFKGTSDWGNGDDYIYLDDVTVKPYSIEKAILANKWYAISSPVHNSGNDETLAGVTNLTSGTYDLYGYTENEGTWNKPTTVLEQGKGYIYRRAAEATLSFVGTPNSDDISYDLSYACSDNDLKGFNLVGNPYPQAATPGMACYSLTPAGLWYAQLATYNAAVCEAVLVKTGSTDNEVSFSTGAKGYNDTPALAFTVSNEEFEDVTYAMLDNGDGLPKIGHIATNAPELSIPVAGRRYAIATLGAEAESFELNFRGIGGEYTLTLNAQRSTLNYCHLIDRATNKEIDLLGQPTYTFNATGSDGSRFLVKLKPDAETVNTTFAIWNGEAWVVNGNGTLQVFDVLGRQLLRQDIQGSEYRIQNSQFPSSGVYILRLGDKSQKIVVK